MWHSMYVVACMLLHVCVMSCVCVMLCVMWYVCVMPSCCMCVFAGLYKPHISWDCCPESYEQGLRQATESHVKMLRVLSGYVIRIMVIVCSTRHKPADLLLV